MVVVGLNFLGRRWLQNLSFKGEVGGFALFFQKRDKRRCPKNEVVAKINFPMKWLQNLIFCGGGSFFF